MTALVALAFASCMSLALHVAWVFVSRRARPLDLDSAFNRHASDDPWTGV